MTTTATTLVTGRWRGRISSDSIQIGSVVCWPGGERRDDHLVEGQREGEHAAGEQAPCRSAGNTT